MSKKWLNATFLSFTGFASRIRSRAAKPAKNENLWVFIRSAAHVVRAGLNIRGCGPLSTPEVFDRLAFVVRKYFVGSYMVHAGQKNVTMLRSAVLTKYFMLKF